MSAGRKKSQRGGEEGAEEVTHASGLFKYPIALLGLYMTSSPGSPWGARLPSGLTTRATHPESSTPPDPSEPSARSVCGNVTAVHVSVMPYACPIHAPGRTCTSWLVSSLESGAAPDMSCRTELRSYFFTAGCLQSSTTIGGTMLGRGGGCERAVAGG